MGLYGWVVPSLSVGPWVPRRGVLSFMYLCVGASTWLCVVLRVLEHCAAMGRCVCVVTGRLCHASPWGSVVKLCSWVVSPGDVMSLDERRGVPL